MVLNRLFAATLVMVLTCVQAFAFETRARAAFVMDQGTGTVLLSKNADEPLPPLQLRAEICQKLIIAGRKHHHKGVHMSSAIGARNNQSSISGVDTNTPVGITTVGQLLRLTPPALLRALDPLLINGK